MSCANAHVELIATKDSSEAKLIACLSLLGH
jgi:hypothetical protein